MGEIDGVLGAATFEAIMDARSQGLVGDTLLFWRPEKPTVYVGYHQLVYEDINVENCRAKGIPIVRRVLGGGTGYCDKNQIIYNVIYKDDRAGMPAGPRNVYNIVLGGVVEALRILGIGDAVIDEERFSVYANGKKISGSGQLTSRGVVNASGSFLADFDFPAMKEVLNDPVKNLKKGIREPEDGMTCLRKELGRISIEEAKDALKAGFDKVLGPSFKGELTEYEKNLAQDLSGKYILDEWIFRADNRKKKREKP